MVASSASLQTGAAVATTIFSVYGPVGVSALRYVVAAPIMVLIVRPRVRGRSAAFWMAAGGFGVVLALMTVSLYEAIDRLPLGTAVTVQFLGPLAVAVAGAHRRLDVVWIAAAAIGVAVLAGGSVSGALTGFGFALVAAVLTGLSIVLAGRLATTTPGFDGLAIAIACAGLLMFPIAVTAVPRTTQVSDVAAIVAVALLVVLVPFSLEYLALSLLPARTFGVLLSLDPAVAALAGLVWLGQRLSGTEVLAIGLVVVASIGATTAAPRGHRATPADEGSLGSVSRRAVPSGSPVAPRWRSWRGRIEMVVRRWV